MSSWIKLHRSLKDWEWYDDKNAVLLLIHLLVSVNYEDKKWHGIDVKAGSLITSWANLSQDCGLTVKQTRVAMKKLEESGEVARLRADKWQVVTLVKWEKLQFTESKRAGKRADEGQLKGRQRATTKEYKEIKEVKNIPTFLDFKSYALSKQPDVSLEALKYKYDAWVENGWKNGKDREIKNWKTSLLQTLHYIPKQPKKVRDLDQEFYENVMKQVNANK